MNHRTILAFLLPSALLLGCEGSSDQPSSGGAAGAGGEASSGATTGSGESTTGSGGTTTAQGPGPMCGDGAFSPGEQCEDGNTLAGDGCSATCQVESGYFCGGRPSVCNTICGDGFVAGDEACDDDNASSGDGCSATCTVEPGWSCGGEPSACAAPCGDGVVAAGAETCDDGNVTPGDGCGATCVLESGWSCNAEPSVCTSGCGDGVVVGSEACDDGNLLGADGCSPSCGVEPQFGCVGQPSTCERQGTSCIAPIVASDGFVFAGTNIGSFGDDLDFGALPGCTNTSGVPNTSPDIVFAIDLDAEQHLYVRNLGTESLVLQVVDACGPQACAGTFAGPGVVGLDFTAPASGTYYVVAETFGAGADLDPSAGYQLAFDVAACGNGSREYGEGCDDGNNVAADGCTASCAAEVGFVCGGGPPEQCYLGTCAQPIPLEAFPAEGITGTNFSDQRNDDFTRREVTCAGNPYSNVRYGSYDLVVSATLVPGQNLHAKTRWGDENSVVHIVAESECSAYSTCMATSTSEVHYVAQQAETVRVVFEAFGYCINSFNCYSPPINVDVWSCGNGRVEGEERCDDGNEAPGDGCSATCTVEPGFYCTASPSACTTCAAAAPAMEINAFPFQLTGNIDAQPDHGTSGPGCSQDLAGEILFKVDLLVGQTVRMAEFNPIDVGLDVLQPGSCDVAAPCAAADSNESTAYQALVSGPVYLRLTRAWYTYSDFDLVVSVCGDGIGSVLEGCDDGNVADGDGCSHDCAIDAGYDCTGEPSSCSPL